MSQINSIILFLVVTIIYIYILIILYERSSDALERLNKNICKVFGLKYRKEYCLNK